MGPFKATKTCLGKSLSFSGGASRTEYWFFLPVGLALPAAVCVFLLITTQVTGPVAFGLSCLALMPLAAVTTRRLSDSGENPADIQVPLMALVMFCLSLICMTVFGDWASRMIEAADSPGGFFMALFLIPVFLIGWLFVFATFLFGLFTGASLFGMMLLPSTENRRSKGRGR